MKQKEFKQKMPACAAFIDDLCDAFGAEMIHAQIRKGLAGEPTFHAMENGYEIGTRVQTSAVLHDELGISYCVEVRPGERYWEQKPEGGK